MKSLGFFKPSFLKTLILPVLFGLILAGCGGGGDSGGGDDTPTPLMMKGSAFIPGGSSSPKTGLSKVLPGSTAFNGATVKAKSLTTGTTYTGVGSIAADGLFSIEGAPFGDEYIVTARKGNIVVMKYVEVPVDAGSPFEMGEVDVASTARVLMIEGIIEEAFGRHVDLEQNLPNDIDLEKLIEALKKAQEEITEEDLRILVDLAIDATGNVKVDVDLNIFKGPNGDADTDKIASINIYLTVHQIFIKQGNTNEDENNPDVVTNWISGGSNNVIADTVINNFGIININRNVVVSVDDLTDFFDIIAKTETTITSGPANPTMDGFATFFFLSNRLGSTFQCSLDGAPLSDCTSPIDFPVLALGSHTFCVVATDPNGVVDPTPACHTWTIVDNAPQLVSIAVTPVNPSIVLGTTQQFTATGTFTDGSTQDLTNSVSWSSGTATSSDLLVGTNGPSKILRFNETTGAFIGDFTTAGSGGLNNPLGLTIGPDGNLYVSSRFTNNVLRYNGATGTFIDAFVLTASGGLSVPHGLVFGPDGNLYVVSNGNHTVLRYNGTTGAFMDVFASGGLSFPTALIFGPDGNLYVSSSFNNRVLRYNGTTGAFIDIFASGGGLSNAEGLAFGPDGNLYVGSYNTSSVLRYNGTTGAFIDVFASGGSLNRAMAVVFGPDNNLYVSGSVSDNVVRYNGTTGAFIDVFIPAGSGGLDGHHNLLFRSQFSSGTAMINAGGLATGISVGTTPIIATDSGTGIGGSTTLTVTDGLNAGLVAHYPFNGNANDESGNGHHGTVNGATLTTDRFGTASSAYSFDGNDSIDVPDSPEFTLGNTPFTISAWARFSALGADGGYYFMGHDEGEGTVNKWIFWLGNNGISIVLGPNGGWNAIGTTSTFETNRWYHVVIRRDGNEFTAFVDGVSIGTITLSLSIADPNTTFQIGTAEPGRPNRPFRGSIDDVRIYDRALFDTEILDLAAQRPNPALTIAIAGSGTGAVTGTGINCPGDCTEAYTSGTPVTLTAAPAADSVFVGWSGGGCSGMGACTVAMNADQSVMAKFDLKPPVTFILNVTIDPAGTGSGTVSGTGINCPADCTQDYPSGTAVTLTAVPAADSVFVGWTGACTGTGVCTVTINADVSVTAKFDAIITPPPNTVIDVKPPNPNMVGSAMFTFHAEKADGTAEPTATFECKLDAGAWEVCTSSKLYSNLADGPHTFMVKATAGGQTDSTPDSWTWTITTPPDTFIDSGPSGSTTDTFADFTFSSDKVGVTFECKLDVGVVEGTWEGCSSPKNFAGPLADGSYTFHVKATVGAKTDPTPATRTWTIGDILPIFSEDFETGAVDWIISFGMWEVGLPTAGPAGCLTGMQCAGTILDGNYGAIIDSRFESPSGTRRIVLPTVTGPEEIHLRFQNWFSYSTSDSGQVQVSVFDPVTETWGVWVNEGGAVSNVSINWTLKDVDLTAYAGKTIRIGFLHTAVNCCSGVDESTGWYIDDIEVVKKTPVFTGDFEAGAVDWTASFGMWEVGLPTAGPAGCFNGTQCAGTILNGNYGAIIDSRFVSAPVTIQTVTGFEAIHLRFQNWFSYSTSDSGQVQVSVFDTVTETWGVWVNEGGAVSNVSINWTLKDVDLTAYAGKTIRIGFLHTAVNCCSGVDESTGWYIDDIVILKF